MFHTVYDSFESGQKGKDYIGKHSSEDPYDNYKGSFSDESFNPDNKIVFAYSKTKEGAVWLEIMFQKVFRVVEDPQYANKSYQTSTSFSYDRSGVPHSDETKAKQSESKLGEKNPFYGRNHTEESIAQTSRSMRKKWEEEGYKQKLIEIHRSRENPLHLVESVKGTKWWYNPVTQERKRSVESPGPGWENRRGEDSRVGKKHWVNEKGERKFQSDSPGVGWKNSRKW
jgi:hypothetical protein